MADLTPEKGRAQTLEKPVSEHAVYKPTLGAKDFLRWKEMDHESGILGKFFGAPPNAAMNIIGVVTFVIVVTGLLVTIFSSDHAVEVWKILSPILTMVLGYAIGRKS